MGVEISALPTATLPYDGSEVMPIVQAGETRKATLLPYKVYTALLTQTGTDAPVATVLENTLGGTVVWSYNDVGDYIATLSGAFISGKTFLIVTNANVASDGNTLGLYWLTSDLLSLTTANELDALTNNIMVNETSIEIRVYY